MINEALTYLFDRMVSTIRVTLNFNLNSISFTFQISPGMYFCFIWSFLLIFFAYFNFVFQYLEYLFVFTS